MIFHYEQFRKLRLQARWTIPKMSKVCRVSNATLSRWETGTNKPSENSIRMLANVLNIPIAEISDYNKSDHLSNEMKGKTKTVYALSETNNLEFLKEKNGLIEGIEKLSNKLETASLIINSLINSMESAFYIKNARNKYIIANNAFLELTERAKFSNIEGCEDSDFFPQNEAEENTKADKKILDQQGGIINEETYIPGTRKKRWGQITKAPILNSDNRIEGIVCTIKDITEQKELNDLHKMIGHMISKSEICLSIMEIKTQNILYVNNEFFDIFGAEPTDQYNNLCEDWMNNIIHPDEREKHLQYFEQKDFPKHRTYRIIHPKKGIRHIKTYSSNPIVFHNKKCKITISQDITNEIICTQ